MVDTAYHLIQHWDKQITKEDLGKYTQQYGGKGAGLQWHGYVFLAVGA